MLEICCGVLLGFLLFLLLLIDCWWVVGWLRLSWFVRFLSCLGGRPLFGCLFLGGCLLSFRRLIRLLWLWFPLVSRRWSLLGVFRCLSRSSVGFVSGGCPGLRRCWLLVGRSLGWCCCLVGLLGSAGGGLSVGLRRPCPLGLGFPC